MSLGFRLQQEFQFLRKSYAILLSLLLLFLLSGLSVGLGVAYVSKERNSIANLIELDQQERQYQRSQAIDYGGAAYESFYAVWNPPSPLAFAAIGQRDLNPTMLRIRALALEGQIYETDSANPEIALAGRFDYSFVVAYLLPLFIIFVLYDVVSSERESGRLGLLAVTAGRSIRFWAPRIIFRGIGLFLAVIIPLWAGMVLEQVSVAVFFQASLSILFQVVIWSALVLAIAMRPWLKSDAIASLTVGMWLLLTLLIPIVSKVYIENTVTGTQGFEVALLQRETVNDAWDIPKKDTMDKFFATHPEWSNTEPITQPFHWKWYYAFQQVGDETAAELAGQYRQVMLERDRLTSRVAWISPAVAIQRQFQKLAHTDLRASLAFEDRIRDYHARIRKAYYPLLFNEVPFEQENLTRLPIPEFAP
ncbi:MAG: DUF3526 domain-containing protein [Pseudohongiellaceae bacterium]